MILIKILLYVVYGSLIFAGLCIPLYLIIIPMTVVKGVRAIRRGEYVPDLTVDVPPLPDKEIQWIVREPTEHEMRKHQRP